MKIEVRYLSPDKSVQGAINLIKTFHVEINREMSRFWK